MAQPRAVGVIGAGILGLTAALRFAQAGMRVTVIEREEEVGGLVASFKIGGAHLERYYHHLFRSDRDVRALIAEAGLEHALVWPRPDVSSLCGGRFYGFDSPTDVLAFSPLPFADRVRLGACAAYLKLERNYHRLEGQTAASWIKRWMGEEAYQVFWGPLLRAKFGDFAEQIAMPWFWSRVHLRSQRLGYIRGGFYRLYARLAEQLEQSGAEMRLKTEVKSIRSDDSVHVDTSDGAFDFDQLLVTTPTRVFMRLAVNLPDEYRSRYDTGEYYGAHSVILGLNRQLMERTYWLNIHDPGFPFLTVVEHTNFMPASDYDGLHVVYLGNYLPMSDPLLRKPREEVLKEFTSALRRINPDFDEGWVVESHVFAAPFAQPIVTVDYHEHIPPHETPLRGVYLANMFQVYPEDRGQNYSVRMANRVAARMISA
ncbi:MAG TPA: NAD(P)/FAD-dependent oxidoreductase [Chloroflexota bacterium]|nr:NAD(P)/FAD-dependent oxidoreductase [Chloroflexota bacterium]